MLVQWKLWHGLPMEGTSPRQAQTTQYRYGTAPREAPPTPIMVTPVQHGPQLGHLIADILPRQATIRPYRSGKHHKQMRQSSRNLGQSQVYLLLRGKEITGQWYCPQGEACAEQLVWRRHDE